MSKKITFIIVVVIILILGTAYELKKTSYKAAKNPIKINGEEATLDFNEGARKVVEPFSNQQ